MPDPAAEEPSPLVSIATITIVVVGGTCHIQSRGDGDAEELADTLVGLYATIVKHPVPPPEETESPMPDPSPSPSPVPVRWLIDDAGDGVCVYAQRHRRWDGSSLYSVELHGDWLNRDGQWEKPSSPSERPDDFLRRCRFASLEEAVACYREHHGKRGEDHDR